LLRPLLCRYLRTVRLHNQAAGTARCRERGRREGGKEEGGGTRR
jgi:hypothetical protein